MFYCFLIFKFYFYFIISICHKCVNFFIYMELIIFKKNFSIQGIYNLIFTIFKFINNLLLINIFFNLINKAVITIKLLEENNLDNEASNENEDHFQNNFMLLYYII